MRDVVELHAKLFVDLLPLGEDVVQGDVPDHGAKGCGRDALDSLPKVLDVQERVLRVDDLLVDEEVDRDRRVVLGDASLLRLLHLWEYWHLRSHWSNFRRRRARSLVARYRSSPRRPRPGATSRRSPPAADAGRRGARRRRRSRSAPPRTPR